MDPKIKLYAYAIARRRKTILDVPESERRAVLEILSEDDKRRMEPLLRNDA